jgi:hypothetical protein
MKINTDDVLASSAVALGIWQMAINLQYLYYHDDVSSYNLQSVYIGILASSLWLLYHYRNGANYTAVYVSLGLALQLYVLQRISAKGTEAVKDDIYSIM